MTKPMPMGKKLKDEEMKMRDEGKLTFKGKVYDLKKMSVVEMSGLCEDLLLDARTLRRPDREKTREENRSRQYLSRLRHTQAKVVRRESRVIKESNP